MNLYAILFLLIFHFIINPNHLKNNNKDGEKLNCIGYTFNFYYWTVAKLFKLFV